MACGAGIYICTPLHQELQYAHVFIRGGEHQGSTKRSSLTASDALATSSKLRTPHTSSSLQLLPSPNRREQLFGTIRREGTPMSKRQRAHYYHGLLPVRIVM